MHAAVAEVDPRARDEILHRSGDKNLTRVRLGFDPGGDMDGDACDACDVIASALDLT